MHLIIGGVWQGKLTYAKQRFSVRQEEVFVCTNNFVLEMDKRCFYNFERYLYGCSKAGVQPKWDFPGDAVIICQDIFCGIVPMTPVERAWRELAGRTVTAIANQASTVTRVFCGLPMELKSERDL